MAESCDDTRGRIFATSTRGPRRGEHHAWRWTRARAAARSEYFAAFHAAEGYIVRESGRVVKSHSGVRGEIARLMKNAGVADKSLTTFLPQAYKFKEVGDYGIGGGPTITAEDADFRRPSDLSMQSLKS
jgi:uncharacterized protein (UPF0332 family)